MKIAIYGDSFGDFSLENIPGDDLDRGKAWVELFAENIMKAGDVFLNKPMEQPFVPHWNRVISAMPNIYQRLIEAVERDRELYSR